VVRRDRHLRIVSAGGIHQNRRCAELRFDLLVRFAQIATGNGVCGEERRRAALRRDGVYPGLAAFCVPTEHGDLGSGGRETFRQRSAQHARATNDDRHFTLQIE